MLRKDRRRVEIARTPTMRRAGRARPGSGHANRVRARSQRRGRQDGPKTPVVLKLGGELLEEPTLLNQVAAAIARMAGQHRLVIVHGGGREIDSELANHGIDKRAVDGLRITDEATLGVVVGVLAGRVNTRLVAAAAGAGARAVGLTGADAAIGLVEPAPLYEAVDGRRVDLGFVGRPIGNGRPRLLAELCEGGYVPIVASIGIDEEGQLFNVNADTLAAHLAVRLGASRLVMAGATPGVLDRAGRTIPRLDREALDHLITGCGASAGMIAKLVACRDASLAGVGEVVIVDGRKARYLETTTGTAIVANDRLEQGR